MRRAAKLQIKLRDSDFRYVEKLLYDQKTHDAQIALLEEELEEMLPAFSSSIVKFSHDEGMVGDSQPEEWAIIRNESVRAKELHGEIRRRKTGEDGCIRGSPVYDRGRVPVRVPTVPAGA